MQATCRITLELRWLDPHKIGLVYILVFLFLQQPALQLYKNQTRRPGSCAKHGLPTWAVHIELPERFKAVVLRPAMFGIGNHAAGICGPKEMAFHHPCLIRSDKRQDTISRMKSTLPTPFTSRLTNSAYVLGFNCGSLLAANDLATLTVSCLAWWSRAFSALSPRFTRLRHEPWDGRDDARAKTKNDQEKSVL